MRTLLLVATALVATGAVALADSTTKTDRKGDAQGGPFDLKSASVVHAGPDRFRHRVTGWSAAGARSLRLEIGTGGDSRPGYFVAKPGSGKAGIYAFTRTGSKRIGPARFRRHSNRSYSFAFSVEPLGLPPKYRWRWVVVSPDGPGGDRLPNRGFVTHDISTGHD